MTFEEWVARTTPMNGHEHELAKAAWEAATAEEREACAKRLNDRAAELRAKAFPHMHEEKAQILDYAADFVRSNDRVEGRDAASSRRVPSHAGLCPDD